MITKKFGFSKSKRLKKPADFRAVFNQPIRSRSSYFTVLARPNDGEVARLGVMVAKRWVKRAVQRNNIRRVVRESFRIHQQQLIGLDIIVMVRVNPGEQPNTKLDRCIQQQWQELITLWKNG